MSSVPPIRLRSANDAPVRKDGDYVLYWCTAQRRPHWNFALQRAVEWCRETGKPLVVLEALRRDYPWAAPRFHRFVLDGMADQIAAYDGTAAHYYPYLETTPDAGKGLLQALAARATVVVADDAPILFLPKALAAAAAKLDVLVEAVDGNGIVPLAAAGRDFPTAHAFRRYLQSELPRHLQQLPDAEPLRNLPPGEPVKLPAEITERWPRVEVRWLERGRGELRTVVGGNAGEVQMTGGWRAGTRRLEAFLDERLQAYAERNHPDRDGTSGLSPYLHFGHVAAHQVFAGVAQRYDWSPDRVQSGGRGARTGWWRMPPEAEAFLDQLVTWRELGFHTAAFRENYDRYESLPSWALSTLEAHADDPRPHAYDFAQLETATTTDEIWNAAQTQLVRDGVLHNYLRMLWGKKILEWSPDPRTALEWMIELNNRYALDGRDPNSYSGIFWVLGRYDRAWGPEREIYGTVRYMSSQNTARKLRLKEYLARYGQAAQEDLRV